MNETEKLKQEIAKLREELYQLKSMLSVSTMPFELREIIRNEVTKGEDSQTAVTRVIEVDVGTIPTEITIPVNPIGIIVLQWKGKQYKLPYIQ